jgi:hypothetical protein
MRGSLVPRGTFDPSGGGEDESEFEARETSFRDEERESFALTSRFLWAIDSSSAGRLAEVEPLELRGIPEFEAVEVLAEASRETWLETG